MEKINLASIPTKIEKAHFLTTLLSKNIFIKRDDYTGIEFSGNKIRKLEYLLKEAKDSGCTSVITTGGLQSNHCRATVAACVKIGLKPHVLLRKSQEVINQGNLLLDKIFDAKIHFCTPEEYRDNRDQIMITIAQDSISNGEKMYIIPEGGSNALGSMGYYDAMKEIVKQEKENNISFDTIVVAVGSGGTYSGLYSANMVNNYKKRVVGYAVCDDSLYFTKKISLINDNLSHYLKLDTPIDNNLIEIYDNYKGVGYALNTQEELELIKYIAKNQGLILDPVYTIKAMNGLIDMIKKGHFENSQNILFIHTGGLYGIFSKGDEFQF